MCRGALTFLSRWRTASASARWESAEIDKAKRKNSFARRWRRNNPVRASFIFHRALIYFPVICCSVPPPFFDRAERRANICPSQSPEIIWNKHSRRIINPSDIFLAANFTRNRDDSTSTAFPRDRAHFIRGINGDEVILTTLNARREIS